MSKSSLPSNAKLASAPAAPFWLMVESVADYAIYMVDANGIITTWNQGAFRIFGFATDEVLGQHRNMLFTAEDVASGIAQAEQDRAIAHGSASEERWRVRKDGTRFWASGVMTAIHDSSGTLLGFLKIVRDLTERKQAEAALELSENRYRSLFDAIADPLFVYDRETLGYLAVNAAAVKKYGYSQNDFLGMTIKDIRPVEDVDALLDMLASAGSGLENRGIWRHCKQDGTVMEVEISAHNLEYAGRPACVIQARDVTEKRRLEAVAARTNDMLHALADGLSDAVFVKDRDGKYLLFNKAAAKFVGRSSDEVLGKDDTAIFDAESARIAMQTDRSVMESNQVKMQEEQLTAAGVTRIFEAVKYPYRDAHGNVIGVMGISRDITERKRAEEELRQQQRLLRIAGRVARIGGWSLELATQQVTWSDEIREIHEVPPGYQPLLGEAIQFYTPSDRERITQSVQACAANGTPFDFEMELITAKGRRIWVRSIGEAVRDSNGQIVSLQGAFQDISERRLAEDVHRRLSERLATTLENITDGFFAIDRNWRFIFVNAEAERMINRQRADLIGISIWDAFPETLGISFEREYRRAVEQNITVDFEEYFPPLDKWFGVRAYPSEQGLAVYFRDETASRKLMDELVNERSQLVTAQAVAKMGSWETDLATMEVTWSAETYRIFGKNPDQFRPTHLEFLQLVHPEDRDLVNRAFQDSLYSDAPDQIQHRCVMPDGSIKFVQQRWQVIFDQMGKPVRVTGTCQDITERKFAEQAVRESEERFRLLSKATNDAIWDWDLTTDNHWWNEGIETLFGFKRAEVEPTIQSWLTHIHPADKEAVVADVYRAIHGDALSWSGEYRFLCRDGSTAFVLDRGHIIRDHTGKAVRMIGGMTDLTERKLAEEELLLRDRAIQAVSQGILITDASQVDNPIVFVSSGFERMTGYRSDEVIGRNCRFLQGQETDQDTVREIHLAIAEERSCVAEILNYQKDGKPFWNQLAITPVLGPNGQLTHFVGVQTDVTEQKRLGEQYRQSQKMEAVGRLAGGIAHDFNNLLTIILGNCELLLEMPELDSEIQESIDYISEAGERAAALTRQLLGFSRQTLLQPQVLDPNAVVSETANMLQRLIGEDILFKTILDPQISRIRVDPGQLNQVLMNLAVNARDAMPQGGKLTIETSNVVITDEHAAMHLECKAGLHVMLAMSDTGFGMTSEVMERIFEPFYTTKEVGHGTGLGLSMVIGIVQQSGGCIHVYSEPGLGTTFKIYLPAIPDEISNESRTEPQPRLRGTERILLVEDEENVRSLALKILKKHGYQILSATDGRDALNLMESHLEPIHLIVTDVVMPHLSGPELANKLKSKFPGIKVLFMSGYTDDAVLRHGLIEAEMPFIQKPYTPQQLARKVRQVLDENSRGGGEALNASDL